MAILAVLTAYIRLLGGASGAAPDFPGPMAKTLGIYLIALTCLLAAIELGFGSQGLALYFAFALPPELNTPFDSAWCDLQNLSGWKALV